MIQSIETCFNLKKLDEDYEMVRDTKKIAQEVIKSIEFLQENNIEISKETNLKLLKISSNLEKFLDQEITNVASIQNEINLYNNDARELWNEYLSNPLDENGKNNFLIHNFTSGIIKGDFRDKYMSTSLITNNAMGIYGSSGFGYIIKPNHIIASDSKDMYTRNYTKDDNNVTNIKHSIKLPQQIEFEMIEQCKKANGEILNSDNESIYSEVIVDDYEIAGIFLITNGEKELNPYYTKAMILSREKDVPFKELDLTKIREEKGLEPLTEKMKKKLCRNLLYNYSFSEKYGIQNGTYENYASNFISTHYEEFADRFMKIKKQDGYTARSIEKEFRKMILDDAVMSKHVIHICNKESISYYQSYFLGKVTEEEFKYIVSNRSKQIF